MKLIDTAGTPKDLRDKWDRYETTQYDKISRRHELAKKIATFCALCAFGMLGLAITRSGKESTNRVVAAATFGLAAAGIVLAQKPLDNKTFKRLQQERKNWFGTIGPAVSER